MCLAVALLLFVGSTASEARAEIRFWVDSAGVTHFSNDDEGVPAGARAIDAGGLEPIRTAWHDGLSGPPAGPDRRD